MKILFKVEEGLLIIGIKEIIASMRAYGIAWGDQIQWEQKQQSERIIDFIDENRLYNERLNKV